MNFGSVVAFVVNLRWICACSGNTSLAGEVTTRSPFSLSSVCPDILFVGVCNDVDYLMLNVIVEFGLRGEGVRECGYSDHQDQVVHQDSRRLPDFKGSSTVSSRFPYTSGLCRLRCVCLASLP